MNIRVHFALFSILLAFHGQAMSQQLIVPIATGEWKPYVNDSKSDPGIFIEIINEVFKKMDMKPAYEFYPWVRAEYTIQKGYAFAACPYIKTKERMDKFDFSEPVVFSTGKFFYQKDRFPNGISFKSLQDLKPYYISGVKGYWYEHAFESAGLKIEYVNDDEIGFRKLAAGRIDLVPTDEIVGWQMIGTLFPDQRNSFATIENKLNQDELCLMISKKYPDSGRILRLFNTKLLEFKSGPVYNQILAKYGVVK